jgi:transposase
LKLLFYGYAVGVRSGRKITSACETDTAFMYLAQMYRPDFRTINDFRKNNVEEIIDLFSSILAVGMELGMVRVGVIAIDGTKLKANASVKRTRDRAGHERRRAELKAKMEAILSEADATDAAEDQLFGDARGDELPAELRKTSDMLSRIDEVMAGMSPGAKVNLTDPEAKLMRTSEGKVKPAFNGQTAVSEDGFILAAEVTTDANDEEQLQALIEAAEANLAKAGGQDEEGGRRVRLVLADAGYASYDNYEYLKDRLIDAYVPDRYLEEARKMAADPERSPYHKERFTYDPEHDLYICPQGKPLVFKYQCLSNGKIRRRQRIYQGTECASCPVKGDCTKTKIRSIRREMREGLQEEMRAKLKTEEGKEIYRKRMNLAEAPFGHLKQNLGYRYFLLRGRKKAQAEFSLMCSAVNLKKMWAALNAPAPPASLATA